MGAPLSLALTVRLGTIEITWKPFEMSSSNFIYSSAGSRLFALLLGSFLLSFSPSLALVTASHRSSRQILLYIMDCWEHGKIAERANESL